MNLIGILLLGLMTGCTTMSERYSITEPDGTVTEYRSRVMALGNGAAEFVSGGDGTTVFSTEGKGISDNGTKALGEVAKGAVAGAKGGL